MLSLALYEPEIPPNTGNIIRLCANTGMALHLIHPLGFSPTDKHLKRAGLDYHEWAKVHHHAHFDAFLAANSEKRIIACSTKGGTLYTDLRYQPHDLLLLGPETRGLPQILLQRLNPLHIVRIPMLASSRSLNLSNAAAVISYEAIRQIGFDLLSLK